MTSEPCHPIIEDALSRKPADGRELSDEELVERVKASLDTEAYGLLYDRFSARVYRKCLSMTRDRALAHDLTHDIFLKAFLSLNKFDGRSKFGTWLYRISFNYCLDHLRRRQRGPAAVELDAGVYALADEDLYEEELMAIRADRLETVLDAIDPTDRAVLLFKYQDDMSVKEMMEVLEMSESAVKMRLLRARERALGRYKQLFPDDE